VTKPAVVAAGLQIGPPEGTA